MRPLLLLLLCLEIGTPSAGTISPILLRRIDAPPLEVVRFGQSVSAADLDGDGVPDFAVGGNDVRVYSGADGHLLRRIDLQGAEVDFVGDVTQDGVPDLLLGSLALHRPRHPTGRRTAYSASTRLPCGLGSRWARRRHSR